jgi:phosphoribosyl-ATP pyrophosphohydrolase
MTLAELFELVVARRESAPAGSYTASLFAAGEDEIVKKVGEEAIEVVLAVKGQGDARVIEEVADLYFHSLVLLAARGLSLAQVEAELARRHAAKSISPD